MIHERTSKTPLSELQALVGGDICIIPGWHVYNSARCDVVGNEDGLALALPANAEATRLYQESTGHFGITCLVGDFVVVYGGLK